MAGKFSVYMANKILDKVLRGTDFTPTTSYWLALFKDSTETALRANIVGSTIEVSTIGTAYSRIEVRGGTAITFTSPVDGASETSAILQWPSATATWGNITYAALMDTASYGTGNVIVYGALLIPKMVDTGDTFRINAGALDIIL